MNKDNLEKTINSYPPGSEVKIHAFRRDELMEFILQLNEAPSDTCYLEINESATPEQQTNRQLWLGQSS
jgi:predicted metalloprotease with PDZ domain